MLPRKILNCTASKTASGSFSDHISVWSINTYLPKSCGHSHLLIKIWIWFVGCICGMTCTCSLAVNGYYYQWRMQNSWNGGCIITMREAHAKISKPRPLLPKTTPSFWRATSCPIMEIVPFLIEIFVRAC